MHQRLNVSDPVGLLTPPHMLFAFGLFFVVLGLAFMFSGKAWVRFQGWVYHSEEPKLYWYEVGLYLVCGLALMLYSILSIPT